MFTLLYHIKRFCAIILLLLCSSVLSASAQYFDLAKGKHVTIPFKMVRNLIVIQLKINEKGPYNFVVDTGVGFMLITEPSLVDSINIPNKRTIKVSGFGEGEDYEAFVTPPIKIDIPGLVSTNITAAILKKDRFNLSSYAGVPIHGLLGNEFFSHLAVKVSFADSTLQVCYPYAMHYFNKDSRIPITIEEGKPYVTTDVVYNNGTRKKSKLIVDLGAGHFISLENVKNKHELQTKFIEANLGVGIKGQISGLLSRIKEVDLGKYKMKDVIAAFPEDETRALSVPRDGNIGIGLLKKFDIIFDYPNNAMYLRPARDFAVHSEHDMSGLVYYSAGNEFDHIVVDRVEPGSAADEIGLEKNDEIISINFKPVTHMTMQQIDNIFKSQDGRGLILEIYRNKKYYSIPIILKRRI